MTSTQVAKPRAKPATITHEHYVQSILACALAWAQEAKRINRADASVLSTLKLTYGTGQQGQLGVTYYHRWDRECACPSHGASAKPRKAKQGAKQGSLPAALVGICATGQESLVGLCGTVLHELGHVMAGLGQGHGPTWAAACARLGLTGIHATFTSFSWENFEPSLRQRLQALPAPNEGRPLTLAETIAAIKRAGGPLPPAFQGPQLPPEPKVRPCIAGFGTRYGTSRGPGSGSRYLLYVASHVSPCTRPAKLRCAGTGLDVRCVCGAKYELEEASLPPAHDMGPSGQGVVAATAREHDARRPLAPRAKPDRAKRDWQAPPRAKP